MKKATKDFLKKITPDFCLDAARKVHLSAIKKESYSQCGEDIIVSFLFESLGIKNPSYADIGAHHPSFINNTYLFYKNGCRGLCVEPDPVLFREIKKKRGRDICLNVGIGSKSRVAVDYYVMTSKTLNTFSKEEAEEYEKSGRYGLQKIEKIIHVPVISINEVALKYPGCFQDFISLDTEGMDFDILRSFDFSKFRPKIWCVETIAKGATQFGITKNNAIIQFMENVGYFLYADTYINTIFVDKNIWQF